MTGFQLVVCMQFAVAVFGGSFPNVTTLGRRSNHHLDPHHHGHVAGHEHEHEHERSSSREGEETILKEKWYSCGDDLCKCRLSLANCSRVAGGLQYVPLLPRTIRHLIFSYNHLKSLPADFFHNATRLTKVDVSHNDLTFIHPHAFRPLRSLKFLFLSTNVHLTYESLSPVLGISTLQELDVMTCFLGTLPPDLFHNATLPRLTKLLLHENQLGDIALSVFRPLKALKELGVATNSIQAVKSDAVLGLVKINLDTNFLTDFPATCNGTSSLFPNLQVLLLQGNSLSYLPNPVCLPRLQTIALGKNQFSAIRTGTFNQYSFPMLLTISFFAMNTLILDIERHAFQNPTVQRIDLSFNNIHFSSPRISADSFAGCPRLYKLDLANNRMDADEEKFVQLFGHLSSVSFVDMQVSELAHLTPRMLSGFRNLTYLHLSRNFLLTLKDGLFDGLQRLQHVDFSQNQIAIVKPTVFTDTVRRRLQSVDLSGNPFSCTCDLLWFQSWLTANVSLFRRSWTTYQCHNIPNVTVQRFFIAPQACLWSQDTYVFLDVSLSLLIVILVLVFGLVRFRWHIRLMLYETFRGSREEARRRHLEDNDFQYDVYVTYDLFDEAWVQRHLIPELEGRLGLRLCLPERDLSANRPELDAISDGVEKSKKILVLFSANFVQNQLCQFQLSMCLSHALEHGDALVIACLDDVAPRHMTSSMMSVLRTTPYIQWAEEVDAVVSFWGRLQIALQEVIPHQAPL